MHAQHGHLLPGRNMGQENFPSCCRTPLCSILQCREAICCGHLLPCRKPWIGHAQRLQQQALIFPKQSTSCLLLPV